MFTLKRLNHINQLDAATNAKLEFKNTSMLSKLITAGLSPNTLDELIAGYANDPHHEEMMSTMEEGLSQALRDQLFFVRNTVISQIEDINELANEKIKEETSYDNPINIAFVKHPEFIESEYLRGFVDKYKNVEFKKLDNLPFPNLTAQELIAVAMSAWDDKELQDLVAEVIDSTVVSIKDIYEKNFCNKSPANYPSSFQYIEPSYTPFLYIEQTIVYVLAQGFYNEPHPAANVDLTEYQRMTSSMLAQSGRALTKSLDMMELRVINDRKIVYGLHNKINTIKIIVNKVNYDRFLELPGVTPDTLLGFYNLGMLDKLELDQNQSYPQYEIDKANREYRYMHNMHVTKANGERRVKATKAIMVAVTKIINDPEFERPNGRTIPEVIEDCRKAAQKFGTYSYENQYHFIRFVVCHGLYPYSGAYAYLTAMDRYCSENPNLTPREAATLAAIDVVVDWGLSQLV